MARLQKAKHPRDCIRLDYDQRPLCLAASEMVKDRTEVITEQKSYHASEAGKVLIKLTGANTMP